MVEPIYTPMADKVARLPAWVRQYITNLKRAIDGALPECKTLTGKIAHLEAKVGKLSSQVEAMAQLFQYAAHGGSDYAAAVVKALSDYGIYPPGDSGSTSEEVAGG